MNKYCSLLIILLIVYLAYDYCSNIVEGNDGIPGGGNYNTAQDDFKGVAVCPYGETKGNITSIDEGVTKGVTNPCDYKSVSCINDMTGKDSDWGNNFTNKHLDLTKPNQMKKEQCKLCVMGSKVDGTVRTVLANLGKTPGETTVPTSDFAYDVCDAMVADCSQALFYANAKTDWSNTCKAVENTSWTNNKLNKAVCKVINNGIIQFFLQFMGGIECTMKVKAYEFKKAMSCDLCHITPGKHCPGC